MTGRRTLTLVAALAVLAVAVPAQAAADPPRRVTIIAVFNPITFGEYAFVNGQLIGSGQAGGPVELQQSAPPYTDWAPVADGNANTRGYYSFSLQPSQTMHYRVASQGVTSKDVPVSVAPRITLSLKPLPGWQVRFSGTFGPVILGQTVAIQRQTATGGWLSLTRAQVHNGNAFLGRIRARHPIKLRAYFYGDATHLPGASPSVRVVPKPPRPKPKPRHRAH